MKWQPMEDVPEDGTAVLLLGGQLACNGDVMDSEYPVVARMVDVWGTRAWAVVQISGVDVWLHNPIGWMPAPGIEAEEGK